MTVAYISGWLRGLASAQQLDPELDPFLVVVVGTNNCGVHPEKVAADPQTNPCYPSSWNVSPEHGYLWAKMVDELHKSFTEDGYRGRIFVAAGSDIELAWNDPTTTMAWIGGYQSYFDLQHNGEYIPLFDFGDCAGCTYANRDGSICDNCVTTTLENKVIIRKKIITVQMKWSLDQVLFKAYSSGITHPIPEIYRPDRSNQVSGINAIQWYGLSRYAASLENFERPIYFPGVLTQYARDPSTNTPDEGWRQLFELILSDPITAQHDIPWLTDIEYLSELSKCFDC